MDLYTRGWFMINAMLLLNIDPNGRGDEKYPYTHCERLAALQDDMIASYNRDRLAWSISGYIDMIALPETRVQADDLRHKPEVRALVGEAARKYADTLIAAPK